MEQKHKKTIEKLSKFGFSFFGYNEQEEPLLIAPNGQVVSINVAINFVKYQLQKLSENSSSSKIEQTPLQLDIDFEKKDREPSIEKTFEKEIHDKQAEQSEEANVPSVTSSPQMQFSKDDEEAPFGDGFKDFTFNPRNWKEIERFVERVSLKSPSYSEAWLKELFNKFLQENRKNV